VLFRSDAGFYCDSLKSTGHSIDAACGMFSSKKGLKNE
jgi:hypothetical protein